jgi:hypothetical protein
MSNFIVTLQCREKKATTMIVIINQIDLTNVYIQIYKISSSIYILLHVFKQEI